MKLKPFVFPVLYVSLILVLVVGLYFTSLAIESDSEESLSDITYVSNVILSDVVPVANVDSAVLNPYLLENVTIKRYYYNLEDDLDKQKESIVYYDNTYLPNTGVDYVSEEVFDVVAIMDGTVIDIKEDEMLGKIVEIKHNNDFISSYAGLSEISVQKGENVTIGTKIGRSGTSKLNESLGNHLHLEIYQSGVNVDPLKIIGKNIGDL
ncbi:MAG: M23 family metallopeptidase [Bacilli bacterium]|nr:M23 family metallopeptidase [Bacilli bacterium]